MHWIFDYRLWSFVAERVSLSSVTAKSAPCQVRRRDVSSFLGNPIESGESHSNCPLPVSVIFFCGESPPLMISFKSRHKKLAKSQADSEQRKWWEAFFRLLELVDCKTSPVHQVIICRTLTIFIQWRCLTAPRFFCVWQPSHQLPCFYPSGLKSTPQVYTFVIHQWTSSWSSWKSGSKTKFHLWCMFGY